MKWYNKYRRLVVNFTYWWFLLWVCLYYTYDLPQNLNFITEIHFSNTLEQLINHKVHSKKLEEGNTLVKMIISIDTYLGGYCKKSRILWKCRKFVNFCQLNSRYLQISKINWKIIIECLKPFKAYNIKFQCFC